MKDDQHSSLVSFTIFTLAAVGVILLFMVTAPWGIGANSDSANYIAAAQNLLKGNGYAGYGSLKPLTQWPPFFPFTLAILGFFGIPPLEAARMLNVTLFGLNILAVGVIVKKATKSTVMALAGAWLMLTSTAMINIHSMALSEPWFIFLTLTGLFFLSQYLGEKRLTYLLFAAFLTGLACLDRYDGISLIGAGMMIILLLHKKKISCRVKDSLLYGFVSALPLGLFFLRNYLVSRNLADRDVQFHFPSPGYFSQALDTVSQWFAPENFPEPFRYLILFLFLALLLTLAILTLYREVKTRTIRVFSLDDSLRLAASMVIFSVSYAVLQLAHLLFIHANAAANDRHFSPFFIAGLIGSLILAHRFLKAYPHQALKISALFTFIVLGSFSLWDSGEVLIRIHGEGSDRTARLWKTSPTLVRMKGLPPDALIYSNDPYIIYLNTGRPAELIPRKYKSRRHIRKRAEAMPDPNLIPRLEKIRQELASRDGYLVFFDRRHQWFNLSNAELEQYLPISALDQLPDGVIYRIAPHSK